jgi:hypothetical protein
MTPGHLTYNIGDIVGNADMRLFDTSSAVPRAPWSKLAAGPTITVSELLGGRYDAAYKSAFPDVAPPYAPFGYLALVQLRMPIRKTAGGIILADETLDEERWRTQSALVRLLGPACFRDRQTGAEWVEGRWFEPGDFVRVPMYGGDRFDVQFTTPEGKKDVVRFAFVKEADVVAVVTGDPLNVKNS